MSRGFIIACGLLQLGAALSKLREGHPAMALVWFAYALSNVGLLLAR